MGDLSQNPEHIARIGPWLPRPACSSTFASLTHCDRRGLPLFFTPAELHFAHGFPSTPRADSNYKQLLPLDVNTLDASQAQQCIGNGMHIGVQGLFYSHCLSQLLRLDFIGECAPVSEVDGLT